ncbi:hypothetical protein [Ekhidna sp.]|jgi:hypothetical protein|uniref:hypothetical protein n=1 Tax=Ekhidna sp. TaxID=2608089 RepID=UPI0032EDD8D5
MKMLTRPVLILALLHPLLSYAQDVVYSYEGGFNEEGTSFGLRITETASEAGHNHNGEYLIVLSSRDGSEMYHFRLNGQYYGAFLYNLERISGNVVSNDNVLVANTSTQFNLEIRFHGNQNDWHRVTVHELTPPRGGDYPTFLKIDPSGFASGGTIVDTSKSGIGVPTPSADFHIRGEPIGLSSTAKRDAHLLIESDGVRDVTKGAVLGFSLSSSTTSTSFWQHGRIMVVPDTPNTSRADGKMFLQTRYYNGTAWDWRDNLVLNSIGNVGIGTTSPSEKLEVAGTIYSQEVRVEVAAGTGPDYVFEPTYDLKSLEEIEQYIQSNKHLPEIPSAKEMEANGVQLGEMNMLLLKKIEELTLYQIELLDRIKKLEKIVEKQVD